MNCRNVKVRCLQHKIYAMLQTFLNPNSMARSGLLPQAAALFVLAFLGSVVTTVFTLFADVDALLFAGLIKVGVVATALSLVGGGMLSSLRWIRQEGA